MRRHPSGEVEQDIILGEIAADQQQRDRSEQDLQPGLHRIAPSARRGEDAAPRQQDRDHRRLGDHRLIARSAMRHPPRCRRSARAARWRAAAAARSAARPARARRRSSAKAPPVTKKAVKSARIVASSWMPAGSRKNAGAEPRRSDQKGEPDGEVEHPDQRDRGADRRPHDGLSPVLPHRYQQCRAFATFRH